MYILYQSDLPPRNPGRFAISWEFLPKTNKISHMSPRLTYLPFEYGPQAHPNLPASPIKVGVGWVEMAKKAR